MRRARATLRLTPGLRGNAQDELFLRPTGGIAFTAHDSPISFARTLTAIGLQSGAMALSASSLIAFLFLESLLSLLPRSRF
jgi:hypothetical protein